MPTDPAPEKVAALAAALHDARFGAEMSHGVGGSDPFVEPIVPCDWCLRRARGAMGSLNGAGWDVTRIEEGERLRAAANTAYGLGAAAGSRGLDADYPVKSPCPNGCGCRLWTEDADGRDCGCDGPCCWDSWDDFMADVLTRPDEYRDTFRYHDHPRAAEVAALAAFDQAAKAALEAIRDSHHAQEPVFGGGRVRESDIAFAVRLQGIARAVLSTGALRHRTPHDSARCAACRLRAEAQAALAASDEAVRP